MAEIPQLDAPQVAPEVPQGGQVEAQVTTADAGAAFAAAGDRVGADVLDIGERMKAKVDAIQVADADTAFGQEVAQRLYDPQTGVVSARGADAAARMSEAQQHLGDYRDDIASRLGDDRQRAAFLAQSKDRMFQFLHYGGSHVAEETERADQDAYGAQLKLATQDAVAIVANHGADAAGLAHEAQATRDAVASYGERNGWAPAQVAEHQAEAMTAFHTEVVDTMMQAGLVPEAAGWYAAHRDEMSGPGQVAVGRAVQAGVQAKLIDERVSAAIAAGTPAVHANAAQIVAANGGTLPTQQQVAGPPVPVDGHIDAQTAFAALASDAQLRADPSLYARAQQALDARIRQADFQQRLDDQAAAAPVMQEIQRSEGIMSPGLSARMANLPPRLQAQALSYAGDVAHPAATDAETLAAIQGKMVDDPAGFAGMTRLELQAEMSGRLSRADQNAVLSRWVDLRSGKPPGAVLSQEQALDLTFAASGIGRKGADAALRLEAGRELSAWSEGVVGAGKPKPGPDELAGQLKRIIGDLRGRKGGGGAAPPEVPGPAGGPAGEGVEKDDGPGG